MERKLASVRKVDKVLPIEGADLIEKASIGGWTVVVKKGDFNEGDLAVYFEIDSFLPNTPEFSFLKDLRTFNGKEGYRLRTVKLRGTVSQGLLLPLKDFAVLDGIKVEEGNDLTSLLEIVKWEKPVPVQLAGKVKGNFPHFIRKTDEERVQNIPLSELEQYKNDWFIETIKIDGSSMTVYVISEDDVDIDNTPIIKITTGVCSRNLDLKETDGNSFWEANKKYNITEKLKLYFAKHERAIALQGELYGEGIQNNRWNLIGRNFTVFNIWSISEQKYLSPSQCIEILDELNSYGIEGEKLQYVPIVRQGILSEMIEISYDAFLNRADSFYDTKDGKINEGFVYKRDSRIEPAFSFKAISNEYLLKTKE